MTRRLSLILLLLALSTPGSHAAAQPLDAPPSAAVVYPAEIGLLQQPCAQPLYDAPALTAALKVELASLGVRHVVALPENAELKPTAAKLALVRVLCDEAAQSVTIEIADLATGQKLERELLLSDVQPGARPRALSMAVVMLMESAWTDTALRGQEEAPQLPEAVRAALRTRLREALDGAQPPLAALPAPAPLADDVDARTSLSAAGLVRTFPGRSSGLIGAELGGDPCFTDRLCLPVRAEALLGSQELSDQAGRIASMNLYWLTVGAGLEWRTRSNPQLGLGPFARLGYALAHASVERAGYAANDVKGIVSVLGVAGTLRSALSESVDVLIGVDVGYVPNGVVFLADLSRSAGMAEVTLASRIGLALRL